MVPSIWLALVFSIVVAVCIYLALNRALMRKLLKPLFDAIVPDKHKDSVALNVNAFYDSLAVYSRARGSLVIAALLTIAVWALVFVLAWCITAVFAIEVSLVYVLLIMPVVTLVEILPVSISGLGTREATVIYFFSVVGISSAAAVGFSLGYLLIGTYMTAIVGFIMWLRHPLRTGSQ